MLVIVIVITARARGYGARRDRKVLEKKLPAPGRSNWSFV